MAQLPPNGEHLMQMEGPEVVLFHRHTETEIVRYVAGDPEAFGPALKTIWLDQTLTAEQKCFAAFWAGYFYAHAT